MFNSKELFLNACYNKQTERPPVWFMRQAGRYLPEYQAYKKRYNFVEMIHSPDIATDITLQPIRRYDMDAAILYSDILVVSECFDLNFEFETGIGPRLKESQLSIDDIALKFTQEPQHDALNFVFKTIDQLKPELDRLNKAFIGFCGSPFTVMLYIIEKGSSKDYANFLKLKNDSPDTLHSVLDSLTKASIQYLRSQVQHGVDAIQIFDTWANLLNESDYESFSFQYIKRIVDGVSDLNVPIIVFSKNMTTTSKRLSNLNIQVLGVDFESDIQAIKTQYPNMAVQGNLNPNDLLTNIDTACEYTKQLKEKMRDTPGFIFNLGHGILQHTPLDHVERIISIIKSK